MCRFQKKKCLPQNCFRQTSSWIHIPPNNIHKTSNIVHESSLCKRVELPKKHASATDCNHDTGRHWHEDFFAQHFLPWCSMLHQLLHRFQTDCNPCSHIGTAEISLLLPVELHSEAREHLQKARKTGHKMSLSNQRIEKIQRNKTNSHLATNLLLG